MSHEEAQRMVCRSSLLLRRLAALAALALLGGEMVLLMPSALGVDLAASIRVLARAAQAAGLGISVAFAALAARRLQALNVLDRASA